MRRIREAASRIKFALYQLGRGILAAARIVSALLAIAAAAMLLLHFLHVEFYSTIPDVWPIYQPTGIPICS